MLDKTIEQAIEPNPESRFQSAEDMREALEAALREPELQRRRRRRIGFAFVGAILAGLVGFGALCAQKPEIRARAYATAKPLVDKLRGVQADGQVAAAVTEPAPAAPAAEAKEQAAAPETGATAAADPKAGATDESDDEGSDEPSADQGETASADDSNADSDDSAKKDETKDEAAEPAADAKPGQKEAAADDDMFSAQPVKEASGDKVEAALAEAAELLKSGKKIKAMNAFRKIGKKHRKDARALKAWSEAAAQLKGYGEALRVARQWAKLEKSVEARIYLATMQRKVGQRDEAVKTLNALLQERPGLEEARTMLKALSPEPRLAQR